MDEKVLTFMEEQKLIKKGSTILVAVSGGPDSLALLSFLWRYQKLLHISLHAITVDHQLRGAASAEDATFVAQLCSKWDIPCKSIQVDVNQYKRKKKVGTQVAARALRYDAFRKEMERIQADYLAFGHHADDQIETVLMALTKSASPDKLRGMPVRRNFAGGELIRPLLSVEKADIRQYIAVHGLEARIDASNMERDYLRNRIRLDVVPLLKRENPNLSETIRMLTKHMQDDHAFLEVETKRAFEQYVHKETYPKKIVIDRTKLEKCPPSLQRGVYRLTLKYLYDRVPEQFSYKHEVLFMQLLHEAGNRKFNFPYGLTLESVYQYMYIYFAKPKSENGFTHLLEEIPTVIHFEGGMTISCDYIEQNENTMAIKGTNTYTIPESEVSLPLKIRTVAPGDRMCYDGLNGTKKVQRIFIDEKIPRHQRGSWPILTDASGKILWLIGLKQHTITTKRNTRKVRVQVQHV